MLLTRRIAHQFPYAIRQRGRDYSNADALTIRAITPASVAAEAHGSHDYALKLEWGDARDTLFATCTCPYYRDRGLCKHLWGLLLNLENRQEPIIPRNIKSICRGPMAPRNQWTSTSQQATRRASYPPLDDICPDEEGETETETIIDRLLRAEQSEKRRSAPRRHPLESADLDSPPHIEEMDESELHNLLVPLTPSNVSHPPPVHYGLCVRKTDNEVDLCVTLFQEQPDANGGRSFQPVPLSHAHYLHCRFRDEDFHLLQQLLSSPGRLGSFNRRNHFTSLQGLDPFDLLQVMFLTGRLYVAPHLNASPDHVKSQAITRMEWNPLQVRHRVESLSQGDFALEPQLFTHDGKPIQDKPLLIGRSGLILFADWFARLARADFPLYPYVAGSKTIRIPAAHAEALARCLFQLAVPLSGDLPPALRMEEIRVAPRGLIRLTEKSAYWEGTICAMYDDHVVEVFRAEETSFAPGNRVFHRDLSAEEQLAAQVRELAPLNLALVSRLPSWVRIAKSKLPQVIHFFSERHWVVEVQKKRIETATSVRIHLSSGVDWFDIEGEVTFGDTVLALPEILQRLDGGHLVRLDHHQYGLLPPGWLEQYGHLLQWGMLDGRTYRFGKAQGYLLNALLAERDFVTFDQKFLEFRQQIQQFRGIQQVEPAPSFRGVLRPYQQEGHSWLHFLREFGLGGCLADDMGLGKTVQVLAMLETRRAQQIAQNQPRKPSLLVVPTSLIFNWLAEAERFTPQLNFLSYCGSMRKEARQNMAAADVVITTYGTLRKDIGYLKDLDFDYAILDEAQAIKNPKSLTAKSARLIRADHRLALSGTPVENRLGDLWSIFEFLNPGMLGTCSAFSRLGQGNASRDTLERIHQALKPMLLRRTKSQVLQELPAKFEQTILCELEPRQRKIYDEVRDYFRQMLTATIVKNGLNRSKFHVLEALTRLRQIACHPGLIDPSHQRVKSAKLEALYENLAAVIAEGHKVLVFSQFTTLLAIVRQELNKRRVLYEYLDGQTTHRKQCVQRFHANPHVPVFLLSLKAGGHGLNLTAADYVFILDPWWNPAVETQAIDRAHRLGQTKPVFAYRLISKDTVEEKILLLQQTKRDLADAIVTADTSLIKNLSMDDLQLLLT